MGVAVSITMYLIFRKGFMYKLDVYSADESGKLTLLTPKEIQSQIQFIMEDADSRSAEQGNGINPGIFTAAARSKWAQVGFVSFQSLSPLTASRFPRPRLFTSIFVFTLLKTSFALFHLLKQICTVRLSPAN